VVDGDPDAAVAEVRGVGADEHRLVVPFQVAGTCDVIIRLLLHVTSRMHIGMRKKTVLKKSAQL
jgi:hypothetical protein